MKAIYCPNCGAKMNPYTVGNGAVAAWGWMLCSGCGVQGPVVDCATMAGAKRKAARLMREWIARMEASRALR